MTSPMNRTPALQVRSDRRINTRPDLSAPPQTEKRRLGGDYRRLRRELGVFFGRIAKEYERTL